MKMQNSIPTNFQAWLIEIKKAYAEAKEVIPFGVFINQKIVANDLFHLTPIISLKFRGIKQTKSLLKKVTEGTLASYISTKEQVGDILDIPEVAFAFCYFATHFVLDILDAETINEYMESIESNLNNFIEQINLKI